MEEQEFAESKAAAGQVQQGNAQGYPTDGNGFINIPDGVAEDLPFT